MVKIKRFFSFFLKMGLFFYIATTLSETTIYESVEPNGTTLFSDTPSKNSREIAIDNTQNNNKSAPTENNSQVNNQTSPIPSGTPLNSAIKTSLTAPQSGPTQYVLKITSPEDQSTTQNQLPIPVSVDIQPPLQNGDQLQLIVDGKPYGAPQDTTTISLEGLDKGTHQIQAGVFDAKTKSITNVSLPITFYKHQASLLLPVKGP